MHRCEGGPWGTIAAVDAKLIACACAALIACGGGGHGGGGGADGPSRDTTGSDAPAGMVVTPPANGKADYQLGGAYTPPAGGTIVSRDRTAAAAARLYHL